MNTFIVRDCSDGDIYGIVTTDKSQEEIQAIIDDVKSTYEDYNTEILKERFMEEDISYEDFDFSGETVYF